MSDIVARVRACLEKRTPWQWVAIVCSSCTALRTIDDKKRLVEIGECRGKENARAICLAVNTYAEALAVVEAAAGVNQACLSGASKGALVPAVEALIAAYAGWVEAAAKALGSKP